MQMLKEFAEDMLCFVMVAFAGIELLGCIMSSVINLT